jgi:hypothetical protein
MIGRGLLLVMLLSCRADRDGNECGQHFECLDSEAAVAVGRCSPVEAYCDQGSCRAHCLQACRVVREDFNPCNGGLICSHSAATLDAGGNCVMLAIPCSDSSECPLYRPSQAPWSCSDGYCQHPAWDYASVE